MFIDNGSFPELVDLVLRFSDVDTLLAWRLVTSRHRSKVDATLFAHVHVYEREQSAGGMIMGAFMIPGNPWALCARGRRWPFWSWPGFAVSPSLLRSIPSPFAHTQVLDISCRTTPVPASITRSFSPATVRLVAYRGTYPSLEVEDAGGEKELGWPWPKARLITFADVSTTQRRGGIDKRTRGPTKATVLHLKYDSRRDLLHRTLMLGYTFPLFKPTHDLTVVVSPDRPGPESLRDRRQTTVQILKRIGYWIASGCEEEWKEKEDTPYIITVVVDGLSNLEEVEDEPRAAALRRGEGNQGEEEEEGRSKAIVPPMPVRFLTHDEYKDGLVGADDVDLHYEWPRQPGERHRPTGSQALWVL